mgnify:CR=1 FL=1
MAYSHVKNSSDVHTMKINGHVMPGSFRHLPWEQRTCKELRSYVILLYPRHPDHPRFRLSSSAFSGLLSTETKQQPTSLYNVSTKTYIFFGFMPCGGGLLFGNRLSWNKLSLQRIHGMCHLFSHVSS